MVGFELKAVIVILMIILIIINIATYKEVWVDKKVGYLVLYRWVKDLCQGGHFGILLFLLLVYLYMGFILTI